MAYSSLGTSINFVDRTTVVPTPWVQDVNNVVYGLLGNGTNAPTTVTDILLSLGLNPTAVSRTVVSAGLGQTVFSIPTYVPGSNGLSVYINGVRQTSTAYTETDANTVTFSTGALTAGDSYEFVIANTIVSGGYTLPPATISTLGGVKVGTGLSVAGDGTITNAGVTGLTAGTGITISSSTGNVLISSVAGGTGTVTSVGLSMPAIFNVSGTPVTVSGTLAATLVSQSANTFLAAPDGSAGTPTFRTIVAADIPTLNQNTTGTASNVTGTVTTAHGGTGLTSIGSANQVLGVNTGASGLEYKTITAGTNIAITPAAGSITIATSGLGTMATQNASSVAITGGTASAVTLTAHREKVITANSSTAYTVDASTGEAWKLTMTGNCTLTLSGQSASDLTPVTLYLIQDATGSRTMTWPASVKWGTSGAPTLSTAAGKIDIVTLFTLDNGTTWIGSYRLGF